MPRPRSKPPEGAAGSRRLEEAKDQRITQLEAKLAKKNEVVAELMEAHVQLKKNLGNFLKSEAGFPTTLPHERGHRLPQPLDRCRSEHTGQTAARLAGAGNEQVLRPWRRRYGKVNEHNAALVPRDDWLAAWEKQAIVDFHDSHPLEGYRRLTFMMLDADAWWLSARRARTARAQASRSLRDRHSAKFLEKGGAGSVQPLVRSRALARRYVVHQRGRQCLTTLPASSMVTAGRSSTRRGS